jgi:hypothetical protein
MSLLFIMGGHVKWAACAVSPSLKKKPLEQAVRGFGGVVMRLLLF